MLKKSHTLSPVPFIAVDFVDRELRLSDRTDLGLANIAASVLELLALPVPADYSEPVLAATDRTR